MDRGFSLLEALIATTIVCGAVAALAHLSALAIGANRSAKATTFTSLLAQQKMEQLRALTWSFDLAGMPQTDTTTNLAAGPDAVGGAGLTPSPADALDHNTAGYCDFVDRHGRPLGGGPTAPAGAVYMRRWSIALLPASLDRTIVFQVLAAPLRNASSGSGSNLIHAPEAAHFITLKTRKVS
jgi:type II secretory pathway pseudopilin PulG